MGNNGYLPRLAAAAIAIFAWTGGVEAAPAFMHTAGPTTQPVGHYELCRRIPEECRETTPDDRPVELTRSLWARLIDVNNEVNLEVTPRTDMEIWGVEERWSYPTSVGDCEDYVLEKRRRLIKEGVPAGDLLITVVRQPSGDGHAVLTVRTNLGDYILDNLEARVREWTDTDYRYLKRQSTRNSGQWVAVDDGRSAAVASVASSR